MTPLDYLFPKPQTVASPMSPTITVPGVTVDPIDYMQLEQDSNPTYTRPEDWGRNLDVAPYGTKLGIYDQLKKDLGVSGTTLGMTAAIIGLVVFISVFSKK